MLSLQLPNFLLVWHLMSTASKGLLSLLGKLLTPVMERTIRNSQISGNLRLGLLARLDQLYRFHLKFSCKCSLFLLHDLFPSCVGLALSSFPSTFFWVKTTSRRVLSVSSYLIEKLCSDKNLPLNSRQIVGSCQLRKDSAMEYGNHSAADRLSNWAFTSFLSTLPTLDLGRSGHTSTCLGAFTLPIRALTNARTSLSVML